MRPPYDDTSKLGFGKYYTDYMFVMKYSEGKGWHDREIKKYEPLMLDPAACVLHYSQEIFEGLKAYLSKDGRILLFRPEENARRMNRSARRLYMPEIPEEEFLRALSELVIKEKHWIPGDPGTSLYIRPTMLGVEAFLGVKPAKEYLFYIILSPVGPYYKEGFNPIGIYVEDRLVRASVGGVGDVKTGGNYGASLLAGMKAQEKGFAQVLYLDAKENRYVEEVGSSNVFFVIDGVLVTPPLTGSILPGITRDSVLKMSPDLGYRVEERLITIDEVLESIASGRLTEMFGTGTAAVISPVGLLCYKEKEYAINNKQVGEVTANLYKRLVDIQYGLAEDPYGWVREIGRIN
ncbi:MAG: branched-chain amino acid aminotransferase [Peptococcaceae bacterium]|nr:branched-chain amino acid aminotransferase [Peptococcaceae bacterium]MDH7525084.1 branched-chain amino acid aminotransferase [Peptococcaceae bacterium]